jgi:hypothetical protein
MMCYTNNLKKLKVILSRAFIDKILILYEARFKHKQKKKTKKARRY